MIKRKHSAVAVGHSSDDEGSFSEASLSSSCEQSSADDNSDTEVDISSALTGKKKQKSKRPAPLLKKPKIDKEDSEEDEEGLKEFLQESMAKRNIKTGTEVLKKVKGKNKIVKGEVGGGSFQSMGLHPSLLRSLTLQGYRIPTPIQRLSIPALLANPPRDLVGMARTGSGKSLAYMVPLVQRLSGRHSTTFGARALILLPTRELALQILRVGKALVRGWASEGASGHAGDRDDDGDEATKKSEGLRWGLVVGGEGLDDQFEMVTSNPDVIIATPGRLLHLIVEMSLDLKSVQYVVFDEADRLFEMGFATALGEILNRLPPSRQTLLFSATLPKSLVEFAKAGLENPKLVRLDAESKISSDLRMAFFSVKQTEKEACLLALLRDVIKVPLAGTQAIEKEKEESVSGSKQKHKGKIQRPDLFTAPHQTLIFVATKHHVEYITTLLATAGYAVSHIYGTLDQSARTHQMDQFRRGVTSILVVTDVAARGIDIPVLENVVNYDFPQGARVFVHRVGRTARAGRQGWAWSFVTNHELPYLLDLQLFLGRPLTSAASDDSGDQPYVDTLVLGTFERSKVDEDVEYLRSLDDVNHSLPSLKEVMKRGHAMYERSKGKASSASYKRAKEMMKERKWLLAGSETGVHPVLLRGEGARERREREEARQALLKSVNAFTPSETVFEIGTKGNKGNSANAALMRERRKALSKSAQRSAASASVATLTDEDQTGEEKHAGGSRDVEMADEDDIVAVFGASNKKYSYRDEEFYMSHYQKDAATEKGYSLTDGASFAQQAQGASFDLAGDETVAQRKRHQLNWDKKKKRFVQGDGTGADNVKLVKTESGTKLPATYRSGRFEEWKSKNKVSLPRIGEAEGPAAKRRLGMQNGKRFKHNTVVAAKPLDKLHKTYDRKVRQLKKKEEKVRGEETSAAPARKGKKATTGRRFRGKPLVKVKSELKTVDQIRRDRKTIEKKRAKNARPSRRGKKTRR